jgi:hypothetical protein
MATGRAGSDEIAADHDFPAIAAHAIAFIAGAIQ